MRDTLKYVEGRMNELDLYNSIIGNAFKSLLLVVASLVVGWVVYSFIIPSLTVGKGSYFIVYAIIAIIAFMYVFKPKTWINRSIWSVFALAYAIVMYLTGECIIIAVILMGLLVAATCVGGEIIFTTLLTYRDIKKWVEYDKKRAYDEENSMKAQETLDSLKRPDTFE